MDLGERKRLVEEFWKFFPIDKTIPRGLLDRINSLYSKATNREYVINSLNNQYFRLVKMRSCTHSHLIGEALLGKGQVNYQKGGYVNGMKMKTR